MKRCCFLSPVLLLLLFISPAANAQQKIFNQLKINNASVGIENSVFTDALGSDGKVQHSASFDVVLNDNEATSAVLAAIQVAATPQVLIKSRETSAGAGPQLLFTSFDSRLGVTEEKTYSGIMLDEIKLPDLNGADQSIARIKVKLRAVAVNTAPGAGKAAVTGNARSNNIPVANFRLTMGALPCSRAIKISSISIKGADKGLQNFTVELSGTDAAPWNQWFATGAGGVKKEMGKIELLSNDLKTTAMAVQLADVEIVSYSLSNTGTVTRATVGLRGRAAILKKAAQ